MSKDLAFVLYTIPEPSTFVIFAVGGIGMLVVRRMRRQ